MQWSWVCCQSVAVVAGPSACTEAVVLLVASICSIWCSSSCTWLKVMEWILCMSSHTTINILFACKPVPMCWFWGDNLGRGYFSKSAISLVHCPCWRLLVSGLACLTVKAHMVPVLLVAFLTPHKALFWLSSWLPGFSIMFTVPHRLLTFFLSPPWCFRPVLCSAVVVF